MLVFVEERRLLLVVVQGRRAAVMFSVARRHTSFTQAAATIAEAIYPRTKNKLPVASAANMALMRLADASDGSIVRGLGAEQSAGRVHL